LFFVENKDSITEVYIVLPISRAKSLPTVKFTIIEKM